MSYGNVFEGVFWALKWLTVVSVLFVPLGVWKAVELVISLCKHIKIQ